MSVDTNKNKNAIRRWWVPVGCSVWLVLCLGLLVLSAVLVRGEVTWGGTDRQPNRIWLLDETEFSGIGISRSRETTNAAGVTCTYTRVRYLLASGEADTLNTEYCNCFEDGSNIGACE